LFSARGFSHAGQSRLRRCILEGFSEGIRSMIAKEKTAKNRISDTVGTPSQSVTITAPNFVTTQLKIQGTAPYVQLAFGEKARNTMREKQAAGSTATKGRKREAKDFDAAFLEAVHRSRNGWFGIPAGAIRNAMVSACSIVGFHMTKAKKSIFIRADGFDAAEGTPLIKIDSEPTKVEHMVRNATGVADIRVRAMYDVGWTATLNIDFDADIFTPADIANLVLRAGVQVGIGEGRPFSKNSCGMGWGTFEICSQEG